MLRKGIIFSIVAIMLILSACGKNEEGAEGNKTTTEEKEVVTISAQTADIAGIPLDNLVESAKTLNEELISEGENIEVKVEASSFAGSWEEYRKQFILAFKSKKAPDIYVNAHKEAGWLAKGNYVLPLDELKESEAYADMYSTLWDAVTWKEQIWGAVVNVEARPVLYRKDVLKKLGWTDEEINNLPELVKNGEFTIEDMTKVAKEAKDKGLIEWGIMHRPTDGPDWHMIANDFGTEIYDAEQDKIVLDKTNVLKSLKYFEDLTRNSKVTPEAITSMDWKNIHQTMIDGKGMFFYGGVWTVGNYIEQGAKLEDIMENFGFMLVPAAEKGGKPMTLSQPFAYYVSSQSEHPELVTRLLEIAAAPEYQAKHSVETYHLPFTKEGAEDEEFKQDPFLSSTTYMLDYTTFQPNHEDFNKYSAAYYTAIQAVELGKMTPEEALQAMEVQVKNDMGESIIIK